MRGRSPDNAALPEPGASELERKTLLLDMTGKDPTGMLFPTQTSAAVFANATSAAQAERAESGGQRSAAFVWSQRWTSREIRVCWQSYYM